MCLEISVCSLLARSSEVLKLKKLISPCNYLLFLARFFWKSHGGDFPWSVCWVKLCRSFSVKVRFRYFYFSVNSPAARSQNLPFWKMHCLKKVNWADFLALSLSITEIISSLARHCLRSAVLPTPQRFAAPGKPRCFRWQVYESIE